MIFFKKIPFFSLVLFLCSCGGSDDSESTENIIDNNTYAFTEFSYAKYGDDKVIDLSRKIGSKGNISSIVSKSSDDCIKVVNDTKIMASNVSNRLCTAEIFFDSNKRKGIVSISSSDIKDETFDIVSKTMISNTTISIDMSDELGSDFPSGFELDSELIVIGSATAVSDPITNTIQVTSDFDDDISRIIYIYKSLTSDQTIQGLLLVSNSMKANNIPIANTSQISGNVKSDIVFDLSGYIEDIDASDELQLIDLYSLSGYEYIDSADLSVLNNTKFHFNAQKEGIYDVFYVVSDHRGGIASNVIRFNIKGYADFSPIYVTTVGNIFYPPKLASDVEGVYDYSSTYTENGTFGPNGLTFATFSNEKAASYCSKQGLTLPSKAQLTSLYDQEKAKISSSDNVIYLADNWPSTYNYAAFDGNVDMRSGIASTDTSGDYYVSCVGLNIESLSIPISTVSVQSKSSSLYAIAKYSDGSSSVYQKNLFWEIIGGDFGVATIDATSGVLTLNGVGTIEVKTTTDDGLSTVATINVVNNFLSLLDGRYNDFDASFNSGVCFNHIDDFNIDNPHAKISLTVNPIAAPSKSNALALDFYDHVLSKMGVNDISCTEFGSESGYLKLYLLGAPKCGGNWCQANQTPISSKLTVKHDSLYGLDLTEKRMFVLSYDTLVDFDDFSQSLTIPDKDGKDGEVPYHEALTFRTFIFLKDSTNRELYLSDTSLKSDGSPPSVINTVRASYLKVREDLSSTDFSQINDSIYKLHVEVAFEFDPTAGSTYYDIRDWLNGSFELSSSALYRQNDFAVDPVYTSLSTRIDNLTFGSYPL